jgi:hypothetical protein
MRQCHSCYGLCGLLVRRRCLYRRWLVYAVQATVDRRYHRGRTSVFALGCGHVCFLQISGRLAPQDVVDGLGQQRVEARRRIESVLAEATPSNNSGLAVRLGFSVAE